MLTYEEAADMLSADQRHGARAKIDRVAWVERGWDGKAEVHRRTRYGTVKVFSLLPDGAVELHNVDSVGAKNTFNKFSPLGKVETTPEARVVKHGGNTLTLTWDNVGRWPVTLAPSGEIWYGDWSNRHFLAPVGAGDAGGALRLVKTWKGALAVVVDYDGMTEEEITDWHEDVVTMREKWGELTALAEIFEPLTCNSGWELTTGEDIGAMFGGEILSDEIERGDDGEIERIGTVYAWSSYATQLLTDVLLHDGVAFLTRYN